MADIRLRGRIVNAKTKQPITGVTVSLRRSFPSNSVPTIVTDGDGEFDVSLFVGNSAEKFELTIDKDLGYRYKTVKFGGQIANSGELSMDLGEIGLEPYSD